MLHDCLRDPWLPFILIASCLLGTWVAVAPRAVPVSTVALEVNQAGKRILVVRSGWPFCSRSASVNFRFPTSPLNAPNTMCCGYAFCVAVNEGTVAGPLSPRSGIVNVFPQRIHPKGLSANIVALITLFAFSGIVVVRVARSGFWRTRRGCPTCGYDTRNLPGPICPECGSELAPRTDTMTS